MKSLRDPNERQQLRQRLGELSPQDKGRWGRMSVHQMVCHLDDSYRIALGEKTAAPASGFLQKTLMKRLALYAPFQWPKGVPTVPEVEQGKGGAAPGDFGQDFSTLVSTFNRFCTGLPNPCVPHPMFGPMKEEEWMRWGYLHADHHLRQFGR